MARKFERTKMEFDLYGEIVSCQRPSAKQIEDVLAEVDQVEPKEARGVWCKMLVGLGFSQATLDGLEVEHFHQVVEDVMGAKKKSPQES